MIFCDLLPGQASRQFITVLQFVESLLIRSLGDIDHIIFNNICSQLIVVMDWKIGGATDVLVWQEPLGDIPSRQLGYEHLEDNS